jgi:hypothetical protein
MTTKRGGVVKSPVLRLMWAAWRPAGGVTGAMTCR